MARIKNWDEKQQIWVYSDMFIGSGGGGEGISAPYEMGDQPPTDKKLFWIDTTEDEAGYVSHNMMTDGSVYGNKLRPATKDLFGGIKADPVTPRQVTPVGIGTDGKLYCDTGLMTVSDSGEVISSDCVSDYTHEVDCKIESKNIIKFPYTETTKTEAGVTYTVKSDGTINISGTANDYSSFVLGEIRVEHLKGVYTFSGFSNSQNLRFSLGLYDAKDNLIDGSNITSISTPISINLDNFPTRYNVYLAFQRNDNGIATSGYIKPQFEKGSVATPYTPYIPDLAKVKVTRCGKNLIPTNVYYKDNPSYLFGWYRDAQPEIKHGFLAKAGITYHIKVFSSIRPARMYIDNFQTEEPLTYADAWVMDYTPTEDIELLIYAYWDGTKPENSEMMLYIGNEPERYIPYSFEAKTYTPTADGTVNGMTSLSPDMTILTDTSGVNISATYLADSALYYKKQFEAVNTQLQSSVSYEDLDKALSKGVNSI